MIIKYKISILTVPPNISSIMLGAQAFLLPRALNIVLTACSHPVGRDVASSPLANETTSETRMDVQI